MIKREAWMNQGQKVSVLSKQGSVVCGNIFEIQSVKLEDGEYVYNIFAKLEDDFVPRVYHPRDVTPLM